MRTIELTLPYPKGTGNTSVRHANGAHYLSKDAGRYRALVAAACLRQGAHGLRLQGPLVVTVLASPPNKRRFDMDNALKVLGDALTIAGVWADDSNLVIRRMVWEWAEPTQDGAIYLTIEA